MNPRSSTVIFSGKQAYGMPPLPLDPPVSDGAKAGWMNPGRPFSDAAYAAFDHDPECTERQLAFGRHLLERDPENIWAMLIVARGAPTLVERTVLLREAVRVGQQLWSPQLRGNEPGPAWGLDRNAAPFMGAIVGYASALAEGGCVDEAVQCLHFALRLDPDDSVGAVSALAPFGIYPGAASGVYQRR